MADPPDQLEEELAIAREQEREMESRARLQTAFLNFQDAQEDASQRVEDLQSAEDELREALIDSAIAWLEQKWGADNPCPYCDNEEWTVSLPFKLLLESRVSLQPHFSAVCTNCGNTVLINAVMAGLLPEDNEEAGS